MVFLQNATNLTLATGGALRTATSNGNTALLRAYDVDNTQYVTFGTLTAGNTPTFDLASSVTIGGSAIYRAGGNDVSVADGGTGISWVDPNEDQALIWDDSEGTFAGIALTDIGGGVSDGDKGDIVISSSGTVFSIDSGVIVNADVNASASIALSKLAATTASRALVSDGSGFVAAATTTATEIGYVNGVTSAIQTQIDGKQASGNYITALTGDVTASGPGSVAATIASDAVEESMLKAVDAASDEECLTYESTTGDFEWQTCGSGGGIASVADDSTPQLGGDLDVNGNDIVSVSAGDIVITPDTTGEIVLDGLAWPQADGTDGYQLTTNGLGQLSWAAAGSGGDSVSIDGAGVTDPDFVSTGDIDFVDTSNDITANYNADSLLVADVADGDWGDFSVSTNVATLDADVVAAAEMADADHGDVAWSSGVASVEDVTCTGCLDATNLGTDSVSSDELNATGVESEIEAQVFDADAQNITGVWEVQDDVDFVFGNDANWAINYDESVDNQLLISTSGTAATATTDPLLEILVGAIPTADQQVFGVAKGTQSSNTALFTVDEDGDGNFAGDISTVANINVGSVDSPVAPIGAVSANTFILASGSFDTDGSVDDDDCTDQQGQFWYDTTDQQWEFCDANTGAPEVLGGAGATAWDDIGDADSAGTILFAGHDQIISSAEDGGSILSLGTSDVDQAADTVILNLFTNDTNDTNTIWIRAQTDQDGTPAEDFRVENTGTAGGLEMQLGATGVRMTTDGDGALTLLSTSAGSQEDMAINLDDTSNNIVITSSTGITDFDLGTIDLETDTLDLTGTGTINGLDLLDSTSESTIESQIDALTSIDSIDGNGAVDMDYGSADITDHTFVSDGGTVIIDGPSSINGINALKTMFIPATAMKPRTTGGCAALATVEISSTQPEVYSLDCDASSDEGAQFQWVPPKGWDNGTITYAVYWSHASTTTNFAAIWGMECLAVSNDDAIGASFGTAVTVTDTGGTTNDLYVSPTSSAVTIGGTPADADEVFCRIYRDANAGGDTLAIDARLMGVAIFYTQDTEDDT